MKKEWKAVIAVILSVWLLVMGFELGSYKEKKNFAQQQPLTSPPETTAAPSTTEPTTAPTELTLFSFDDELTDPPAVTDDLQSLLTTMDVPDITAAPAETTAATTAAPTTKAPTTTAKADPAKLSKKEVLAQVTAMMRTLKSEQNMTAVKTEATKIVLTECSVKAAVGPVNKALETAGSNETVTYSFRGGKAVGVDESGIAADEGKTVSPRDVIPPEGAAFALPAEGVESAVAKKNGKDTVYTIKLRPEQTTLQAPLPPWNASAIGYVDFSKLRLNGITLEEVNFAYPGSVVTVTAGENGKIIKLSEYLPLQGDAKAKVAVFSGTGSFVGEVSATWTFSY